MISKSAESTLSTAELAREPAWITASEITANEFVHYDLPPQALKLNMFSGFPPDEGICRRYRRLKSLSDVTECLNATTLDDHRLWIPKIRRVGKASSVKPGTTDVPDDDELIEDVDDVGEDREDSNDSSIRPVTTDVDDDDEFMADVDDVNGNSSDSDLIRRGKKTSRTSTRELFKRAIDEVLANTIENASSEEFGELSRAQQSALSQNGVSESGVGRGAGGAAAELSWLPGHISWKRVLSGMCGRDLDLIYRTNRPPRRFPHLVGLVPAQTWCGILPHLLAVVDTSGSMTQQWLEIINGELKRMNLDFQITVVECDWEIQRTTAYRKPLTSVLGRGGTSFRPPFEPSFLRRHQVDAVVYFTDGFGEAPDSEPRLPVVWCLTEHGQAPASWGRVLRLADCRKK
ncbi:MAG: hypothetical protein HQM09_12705 [Candidatus Riflebacteria bacterium]|nr:hypothetical protein [Candidatus Riflebacteria bacterium]